MTLDIGDALRDGFRRTTKRNALLLMLAVLVVSTASTLFSQTVIAAAQDAFVEYARAQGIEPPPGGFPEDPPLALSIPPVVAGVALVATWIVQQVVTIVAIRTFVSEHTRRIPGEFLRRNIGWVLLNAVVASVVVGALVFAGFLLFVIPGVFLAISFFFVTQEIAVRDENFIDAMGDSWRLVRGERIELFVLALALVFVSLVASIPNVVVSSVAPAAAVALGLVVSAPVSVFSTATAARAYVQLDDARSGGDATGEDHDEDEPVGALGADDIPADHDDDQV